MSKFCSSVEEARSLIDSAIGALTNYKKKINNKNFTHFNISVSENRDIEPICVSEDVKIYHAKSARTCPADMTTLTDDTVTGFRQLGPDMLNIHLESTINLGKEWAGSLLSDCPTFEQAHALDKQMNSLSKSHKKYKLPLRKKGRKK